MGFLIALIAPRLAGIMGDAIDNVCDSNQMRLRSFINIALKKDSRLPDKLVSIVAYDQATTTYSMVSVSDRDRSNGPETLAEEFFDRNQFQLHILSAAEADALIDMGLSTVLILEYTDAAGVMRQYEEVAVAAGVGVAMVGAGYDGAAWQFGDQDSGGDDLLNDALGAPDTIYSMVFGVSQDATIITNGVAENAPNCPGGIVNAENATFNWYTIIVPRLPETLALLGTGAPVAVTVEGSETGQIKTVYLAGEDVDTTNAATYAATLAGQELWQFATQCPEGHKWPEQEEENWTITAFSDTAP